jgi:large subunit ribosomal protein L31
MRADIHPNYVETEVTCSCGNVFTTKSTTGDMHIELCNECHPFFTGRQKLVDTGGRVERFRRRYEGKEVTSASKAKADASAAAEEAPAEDVAEATEEA